jgi:type II secretory pathway pseudopilin PulG
MPRKNSTAFTLIELLVVCGIIAVLIGILVPSIGKARATAKRTRCQANLHSVGQAIRTYMDDYHDYYPPMAIIPTDEMADNGPNSRPAMCVVLAPYIGKQNEVFRCPADQIMHPGTKTSPGDKKTWFEWQGSSYEPRTWLSVVGSNGYWKISKEYRPLGKEITGSDDVSQKLQELYEQLPKLALVYDYELFHGPEDSPGSQMALFADFHVSDMNGKD